MTLLRLLLTELTKPTMQHECED